MTKLTAVVLVLTACAVPYFNGGAGSTADITKPATVGQLADYKQQKPAGLISGWFAF